MPRVHRREPSRSGAAHEPQEEGLGLIVARVTERDEVGVKAIASAREEGVASRAARILDRSVLGARARGDILTIDEDRDVDRGGDRHREPLVPVRRRSQLMVEVRQPRQAHVAVRVQRAQDGRQRH